MLGSGSEWLLAISSACALAQLKYSFSTTGSLSEPLFLLSTARFAYQADHVLPSLRVSMSMQTPESGQTVVSLS